MATSPNLDGPRLLRPEESGASHRLSHICFSDEPPGEAPLIAPAASQPPARRQRLSPPETYGIAIDGRLVSQISVFFTPLQIAGARLLVGSIGGVCTHPAYRELRLAGRLLAHCAARLASGGAQVMVISGARGLYRRAGAVEMGCFHDFRLWPGNPHPAARHVRLRRAQPADAALAARLYSYESVRFIRDPLAYAQRFAPHPLGFNAEEFIVELDGQPAAYLLLNIPWDNMDQLDPHAPSHHRVRAVFEYAGSRVALAGAASAIIAELNLDELQFPTPWQDTDLVHLLQVCDQQPGTTFLPDHTLRLLNLPGLMAALRPYLAAVLSPAQRRGLHFDQNGPLLAAAGADRASISRGAESIVLDGAGMSALVFGSPAGSRPLPGALGEIVQSIFPLPSFMVGLDYH